MKKLMLGLVAGAASLAALPASAQNAAVVINATAPAQCGITGATSATIAGGGSGGPLAGVDGFLDPAVQSRITAALTSTNTFAWCTGGSTIVITRTPLVRSGTNGAVDASGFANAIGFDVGIKIANASRTDPYVSAGFGGGTEGSSDGNLGPGFNAFGPTGAGSAVTFINDDYGPSQSFNAAPRTLNLSSSVNSTGPTTEFLTQVVSTPTRLAAGTYTSTVTLSITPAA